MGQTHSSRCVTLVGEARQRVSELSVEQVKQKLDKGEAFRLLDVREGGEFARGRLPGAVSLCKGIVERDIEGLVPDFETPLVLYCGGGFRSALAGDNLQKMGYKNVTSMWGGWRAWNEAGFPTEK